MSRALSPLALIAAAALAACESGTAEVFEITVSAGASADYTEQAPGLLRVESGHEPAWVLCGDAPPDPLEYIVDHGMGCLEDGQVGTTEQRTAWIEPMPATWDADALCALPGPDPVWGGVWIDSSVTGSEASFALDLAQTPDPSWPQGTGEGTWRRDGSPCGGNLHVEIAVQ